MEKTRVHFFFTLANLVLPSFRVISPSRLLAQPDDPASRGPTVSCYAFPPTAPSVYLQTPSRNSESRSLTARRRTIYRLDSLVSSRSADRQFCKSRSVSQNGPPIVDTANRQLNVRKFVCIVRKRRAQSCVRARARARRNDIN